MSLSDVSIKRPVLALVMSLVIILFGVMGFMRLPVREYPALDPPVVTVTTNYSGASPEVIDSQITETLEQSLNGVPAVRTMSSTSSTGRSQIRVEFNLDADLDTAANDVRDKVSQAINRLPVDADPPQVEKADADSDPIIFMTLRSDALDILRVSELAATVVKERVQTIPGVSTIRIFGERRYAMRLNLDPIRMAAHGVTPQDVREALSEQNVDLPSGRLEGSTSELLLQTEGKISTPEEFDRLIIRDEGGRQVLLRDVGYAELSAENLRSGQKREGVPQIGVAVIPQPNTNAIAIADEFFKRLESIKRELPAEVELDIGFDFTQFVRQSVHEVEETLVIAFTLVTLIIFLFLRDWRSTLVPVASIPVSIVSAFFIMYLAGFSINILTLVALVLAIGLVCDDAIVVLENIYTKVEKGVPPLRASIDGAREIYFAVISTTITLAAVFLPIMFLQGLTGKLFQEFAVVVAGSVLVSAFVALTLSPMMCRYLLRHQTKPNLFYRVTEPFFVFLNASYRVTLRWFLALRWLSLPLLMVTVASSVWLASVLPSELAPLEDRRQLRITTRAPEGATFDYVQDQMDRLALLVNDRVGENVARAFVNSGWQNSPNQGNLIIYLKDPEDRPLNIDQVSREIGGVLDQFPGLRGTPTRPPTIGDRRSGQQVQFVLQAPTLAAMNEALPKFLEAAGKRPELTFVDADLKVNRPQLTVSIDRQRAIELGVSVRDIAQTLQLAFGESRLGYYLQGGRQYQVIGTLPRSDRNDPDDLRRLHVRSRSGEMIPLSSLVTLEDSVSPNAIYRFNRYVSATVSAGLGQGFALADGIRAMRETAAEVLPIGFSTSLTGQSRDFEESSSSLLFAFVLALILIYLVLAAQFDSFIDPFTILLTVPLSVAGALGSLYLTGQTINIFSQIGIIMLIGLVTKNGILIVEFAHQRRQAGLPMIDAVLDASVARFRPILMTSLATILGILPIALALGGAAGSRQSLGIAVVGGMLFSTILTLYIIPAMYAMLASEHTHAEESELEPAPAH